jgi:hypothetical protein
MAVRVANLLEGYPCSSDVNSFIQPAKGKSAVHVHHEPFFEISVHAKR